MSGLGFLSRSFHVHIANAHAFKTEIIFQKYIQQNNTPGSYIQRETGITAHTGESLDSLMRRFKRTTAVQSELTLANARARAGAETRSQKRRRKHAEHLTKLAKRLAREQEFNNYANSNR